MSSNRLLPSEVDTICFHYACPDGLVSAFACWYYMSLNYPARKIDYYPVSL